MADLSTDELTRIWLLRIDDAETLADLARFESHLPDLPTDVARQVQIKVCHRRTQLRAASQSQGVAAAGAAFAQSYGLPEPDGRPLHAYRLSDDGYARLTRDLLAKGFATAQRGHGPGLFVLWAAEWCRRVYAGGGLTWAELVAPLRWPADQGVLRDMTRAGLKAWRRDVLALTHMRQFLGTLAREGGFPAAAIREGGQGWAQRLLERMVGALLGMAEPDDAQALALAEQGAAMLPGLFRDDAFYRLAADLALAIVRLRAEVAADAQAEHMSITLWLHVNRPGWAQTLPIVTGEAVADALVDRLFKVEPLDIPVVGIDRLLVREDGQEAGWAEAVRLGLDGMVDGAALVGADPGDGRLRAFPSGAFANHVAGELGLFEPPGAGETQWQVRASRLGRSVQRLPFAVPVTFDLRAGGRTVATFSPQRGKPRRGQMLVAVRESGTDAAPTGLRVLGSGAGSYRADPVFVQVPQGWKVQGVGEGQVAIPLGPGTPGNLVWRIQGGATVVDETGDLLRLRCGQAQDLSTRLELVGHAVPWAQVMGTVDLFLGPPLVTPLHSHPAARLVMRAIGTRTWSPAPKRLPVGHYELAWRDGKELLDRRRVAILPAQARLDCSGSGDHARYRLSGFDVVSLTPAEDAPVHALAETLWRATGQTMAYQFVATLSWPEGPDLAITIRFPSTPAIARADGRVMPMQTPIVLDDLAGLVAAGEGSFAMLGQLTGAAHGAGAAEAVWPVEGTMPLSSIAEDLRDMLQQGGSIDGSVRLEMAGVAGMAWRVRQFPNQLSKEGTRVRADSAVVDEGVTLCGRWFGNPAQERVIAPYSLLHELNHRPLDMPADMGGLWIVYLRSGERVLTRPLYLDLPAAPPPPADALGAIMALPLGPLLNRAIARHLDLAEGDAAEAREPVEGLIGLVASLRGLPAATFQIIRELVERPRVLARMAMMAKAEQLPAVLALADHLAFAWYLVPQADWDDARRLRLEVLYTMLVQALPDSAMAMALDSVQRAEAALIDADPLLSLALRGSDPVDLEQATQAFLQRNRERITEPSRRRYRTRLPDLPALFGRFDPAVLDVLDAPCAAARAALGHWRPGPADIHHIKAVARRFPTWFSQGFAATRLEHIP